MMLQIEVGIAGAGSDLIPVTGITENLPNSECPLVLFLSWA